MFWWAPIVMRWALEDRMAAAGMLASVGVFAKEFIVVPLGIAGIADAVEGQWRRAFRAAIAGAVAFCVWLGLQAFLRIQFGYTFGHNLSPKFFEGSYLFFWLGQMSPRGALSAMFNEFGPIWVLFPFGWWRRRENSGASASRLSDRGAVRVLAAARSGAVEFSIS
jgi:hypothetical protein